jgi:hypothetical protein
LARGIAVVVMVFVVFVGLFMAFFHRRCGIRGVITAEVQSHDQSLIEEASRSAVALIWIRSNTG